mmetsp:Transcript_42091/g.136203  ORF Transcript_42091/g.136203 Transcript_42091/m.136203 type:complete len:120 (-) Transcript_42091:1467-1826(-)
MFARLRVATCWLERHGLAEDEIDSISGAFVNEIAAKDHAKAAMSRSPNSHMGLIAAAAIASKSGSSRTPSVANAHAMLDRFCTVNSSLNRRRDAPDIAVIRVSTRYSIFENAHAVFDKP